MSHLEQNSIRERRLRKSKSIRDLIAETKISASSLVQPIFVKEGTSFEEDLESMPGIKRYSVDKLTKYVENLVEKGLNAVILFGVTSKKDDLGSLAYSRDGPVPRSIKNIRSSFPELVIIADVCLCEYTSHGHCGIVEKGQVVNDKTLELLSRAAVAYAEAGCDIVAPSAMMDHQVLSIRKALDSAGFDETIIMSYSAKYASSLYYPFRDAAGSKPSFGDRRGYQMDVRNSREAIREIELDIREGADIVMVKPALPNLDIISKASSKFNVPVAAYSVSGEYCMTKSASLAGYLKEKEVVTELTTSIARAGARIIITYYAEKLLEWLK